MAKAIIKNDDDDGKHRKAGEEVAMTEDDILEYIKCKNDIEYFVDNYFYILTGNDGEVIMNMLPTQRNVLRTAVREKDVLLLCSRQYGKCFFTGRLNISKRPKLLKRIIFFLMTGKFI